VDQKITQLQILVMEQQQAIEVMSDQLIEQSARCTSLEKKLALLESKLLQVSEESGADSHPDNDRPPHY
jgi:uncharacterized coiled-coil protein SlyX